MRSASYVLKNCKYDSSAIEEAKRIKEHLKPSDENYASADILELTFDSNGEHETVKIKNGIIL